MTESNNIEKFKMNVDDLILEMTLEEKVSIIHASLKFESGGVERLGINNLIVSDGPHGVRPELIPDIIAFVQAERCDDFSVYLPTELALASTWNSHLAYEFGKTLGLEARNRGKEVLLGPGINIIRTPLNGRNFEYMSEDPYLTKILAVQYIKGVQSQGIAACAKHFVANNQEWERFTISVEMDERTLREIYLPAFKSSVIDGGVKSIMGAYNQFRGQYCCHNNYMLNHILKEEWGFEGFVMSDWNGTHDTIESGNNGLDLEMGTEQDWDNYYMANPLIKAVKNNEVPMSKIDEKVKRIFEVMSFVRNFDQSHLEALDLEKQNQFALNVARESIVLLKNDNQFLPLNLVKINKVLVVGANATRKHAIEGGSSQVKARYEITPLEGIQNHFKDTEVIYCAGYSEDEDDDAEMLKQQAIDEAKNADVVIIIGGLNHTSHDREYFDREDMNLPYGQDNLIEAIVKVNQNTVVSLVSGTPNNMNRWISQTPAIIQTWYNGMEGGNALAEVLIGKTNPSGKLTITFPKELRNSPAHSNQKSYPGVDGKVFYEEGIFVGYRHFDKYNVESQFCFGHGLSYSSFEYSNLNISSLKMSNDTSSISVTFNIKNISSIYGAEISQLYIEPIESNITKAVKELKGFSKVNLRPKEKQEIKLEIRREDFQHFVESENKWKHESGSYKILIGSSSVEIHLSQVIEVD